MTDKKSDIAFMIYVATLACGVILTILSMLIPTKTDIIFFAALAIVFIGVSMLFAILCYIVIKVIRQELVKKHKYN